MKILCLADAFWPDHGGGIVKAILPEIEELARTGHEVIVLSRRLTREAAAEENRNTYKLYRYGTVSLGPASGPVSSQSHLPGMLRRLQAQYSFDVVYANNFQQTRVAEKVLQVPVLMAYHASGVREISIDIDYGKYGVRTPVMRVAKVWVRHVEGAAIANATRLLTRSRFMAADLRRLYPHAASVQIETIPLCVDTSKYLFEPEPQRARAALKLPTDRKILFTVRRLVPRMGLENLIAALRSVRERHPEALLLIGGKGPLGGLLQRQILDLGLQDHVRMLGYVAEKDLVRYYQAADLFVLPTMAYEGFGLVTLEAWSCGTPVLCTPVGANPEVVGAFGKDWLMTSGDVDGISEGISRVAPLLNDPHLRQRCRDYCEAHFTPGKVVHQLEQLLASMIK